MSAPPVPTPASGLPWKRLLVPTEHGSWALTFEPVVLGLLVAHSGASAWIAGAVAAGFLARKPAKLGWGISAAKSARVRGAGRALACTFAVLATLCLAVTVALAGFIALTPLAIAAPGVAYFAWCDRTGRTRSLSAEMIGTAVCALPLVAIALASSWNATAAVVLGLIPICRSLPTLLLVRACLRRSRGERVSFLATWISHFAGVALLSAAAATQELPWTVAAINAALIVRAAFYVFRNAPTLTARQIGMIETAVGVVYISLQALALAAR